MSQNAQVLVESIAQAKLRQLDTTLEFLLGGGSILVPSEPGRDVQIWPIRELPAKKGLASREGQARLLHDLASIELQAMELGVRTLAEFPAAPLEFREQLVSVTREEGRHFELCLKALEELGLPWGSFPAHLGLWQSVSPQDSLLDRILIVHRYLEGSGLDASDTLLRRLDGVPKSVTREVVAVIRREETAHVIFGSEWYRRVAALERIDAATDFEPRLMRLFHRIPRRLEPVGHAARLAAGFTEHEVVVLEALRRRWMEGADSSPLKSLRPAADSATDLP